MPDFLDFPLVGAKNGLKFVLKINQKVFVEEDKSKNCRNYPNEDFESYAACDDHYMKSLCDAAGLSPIWLTDDINEVTVQTSVNSTGFTFLFLNLSK